MTIAPTGDARTSGTSLYVQPPTSAPEQTIDGQLFLKLLVTQLQNQDPSSPMDTDQMISQTTQLAMMEQLTALSATSTAGLDLQQRTAAAALLGSEVTYVDADGTSRTGTATAVSFAGDVPTVTVSGASVPLTDITGIATSAAQPPQPASNA